jgi:ubiquinone/menaquinone biosynthesis C-methylase UbiE
MKDEVAQKILGENRLGYDRIAEKFAQTRKFPWHEFALFKQYVHSGDEVLDAGCGSGRLYEFLKKNDISYIGIDTSAELITIARKTFPEAHFSVGDILTLPFSDNKFNVIFCIATLHHIPGKKLREQVIKEFHRVLRPGGYLIMTNWNLLNVRWWPTLLHAAWQKIIGKNNLDFGDVQKPWKNQYGGVETRRYLHAFTKGKMKRLLQHHGFTVIKQWYTRKDMASNRYTGFNLPTIAQKS